MAYRRRKFNKKWRKKKRTSKSKVGRPSKGLTQSRYFFKRKLTNLITLSGEGGTSAGGFWTQVPADLGSPGACVRWQIKLSDLPDNSEFSSGLFSHYRINAMKVRVIPQFNTVGYSATTSVPVQVTYYTMPYNYDQDLTGSALTEAKCLQTQACKTRTLINSGNGSSFYAKCRQTQVYPKAFDSTTVGTIHAMRKPQWIPCSETDVMHYGLIQRFQPNHTSWPANMACKLIVTAYLEFRGVV